jgi:hypothetical protein
MVFGVILFALAIVFVWGISHDETGAALAHYKRGEELKFSDLKAASQEFEACLSKCPDGWQKDSSKQELAWIEPAIAAGWSPQYEEAKRNQDPAYGEQIDYPTFFAKSRTGLPIGKRYRFYAILSQNLCIKSDSTYNSHLCCDTRAAFDNQAEYESLLRGTDNVSGTIVASMGADGIINIHSFH